MSQRVASKEEVRIVAPFDTPRAVWSQALNVAFRFAVEHVDRLPGWLHCVAYVSGEWVFVVYWTRARRIVVHIDQKVR